MIVLAVVTDGRRDCIERTIKSAKNNLIGPITTKIIWDDSDDDDYFIWLSRFHGDGFTCLRGPAGRSGFGGAIRQAWNWLEAHTTEPFVAHLEDDFVFNRPIDLKGMAATLGRHPHLAQMALRRQPWSEPEKAAGGVVEQWPEEYEECSGGGFEWLEHRLFWTSNVCLYRRELMAEGWPTGNASERMFTHRLMSEGFDGIPGDEVRCGYWGSRDSGEAITHIGDERIGVGY